MKHLVAFLLLLIASSLTAQQPTPMPTPVPTNAPPVTPVPTDTPTPPAPAPPAAMPVMSTGPSLKITGQVRERTEVDSRSFSFGVTPDVVHLLRSRLAVSATIDSTLGAHVEVQDARVFGQTKSTLNIGAPAFDLRQAWLEIKQIAGAPLALRVGRQAIGYANERLIGRIDWRNDGQSFDGAVATIGGGEASVDLLGLALARNANTPVYNRDVFLAGAWAQWRGKESPVGVQGYFLFDDPRLDPTHRQNRFTTGLYSNGAVSGFDYELEGTYQFGDDVREGPSPRTVKIAASMIGARVGYTLKELASLRIGVGYDRLSGTDPQDSLTYGAFHTLYGTNHKFYGFMDYLLNIPVHTKGMGLQDMMVNLSIAPLKTVKVGADLHLFALAVDPAKLANAPAGASSTIGTELDLSVSYAPTKALNVTCNYAVFDGDPNRLVLNGPRRTTQWGFVMLTVGF